FQKITPIEFYEFVLNEIGLPAFDKPALIRSIFHASGVYNSSNKFTYSTIPYRSENEINDYFEWYIEQISIPKVGGEIFYSLIDKPEIYDVEWAFSEESRAISEEIKEKIEEINGNERMAVIAET